MTNGSDGHHGVAGSAAPKAKDAGKQPHPRKEDAPAAPQAEHQPAVPARKPAPAVRTIHLH